MNRARQRSQLRMEDPLSSLYAAVSATEPRPERPFVTLTFAQSLDGSIAAQAGVRTTLSGDSSLAMSHTLRTLHDAILVGIGTVLIDDPQLTARHARGPNPRPIVLDSNLRLPRQARLLQEEPLPWIACSIEGNPEAAAGLEANGVELMPIEADDNGLNLNQLLHQLQRRGIEHLMVEGGARVINSFLHSDLVDLFVLTLAPRLLDGLRPYALSSGRAALPALSQPQWARAGDDVILWARPQRAP